VNTFISRGIWCAWLLLGALISASLDSVPDFPAVIKHARASQSFQLRSHSDPASRAHQTVPVSIIPLLSAAFHWPSFSLILEGAPSSSQSPFVIWQASDSSPPLFRA
jgi:hypothetical protein